MPNCLNVMHQYGNAGNDIRSMSLPAELVDICEGDFLGGVDTTGVKTAQPISANVAWDTNLATTQIAAKAALEGVSLFQVDATDGVCNDAPTCIPYAKYRQGVGFTRAYEIVGVDGVASPTTWVEGAGFTIGKNPDSNALVNDKIQRTDVANEIIFRAVKSSGAVSQGYAEIEFAD